MIKIQFSTLIQYLAPQRTLTRLAGWLGSRRWSWLKNWQIRYFIKRYQVDLTAALSSNIADYPDFNSFFTRQLKPGLRPIAEEPEAIISPADGCISQIGNIEKDRLFQAKGFDFSLSALLGGQEQLADEFHDGYFATIYLSPKDYHRVHMPMQGKLRETIYIPGKLFSVNQRTAEQVPQLFARNERLVCLFDTALGPMAVILVGAMLVGSINTAWGKPLPSRTIQHDRYPITGNNMIELARGAELGYFKLGSTAILLFPQGKIVWEPTAIANANIQMGQRLAKICAS